MSSFKQTRPPLHIGVFVNLQQVQRRHLLLSAVLSSPAALELQDFRGDDDVAS
jgi:hypothetical protein